MRALIIATGAGILLALTSPAAKADSATLDAVQALGDEQIAFAKKGG